MGKIGKISIIPKDYGSAFPTMEKSLRDNGMSRAPGTVKIMFPFKEMNGRYRTGLDEHAPNILRMEDPKDRDIEQKRVKKLRIELEEKTGIDLSPNSTYYNHTSKGVHKVQGIKLTDGDNIFNLDDHWQAITFNWLRAHPSIASSLKAYQKGQYPSETHYYVNDEDVENEIVYHKKKTSNDAIIRFDSWSLEKRRKVARLLDLPVGDDAKEESVYNMVDNFLKSSQVNHGSHKGKDPIKVFGLYADLKDDVIYTKDIIEQAIKNGVYRERKGGRIYEGEQELFKDKDQLIEHLLDSNNQEDVLTLEKKLKIKKMAEV